MRRATLAAAVNRIINDIKTCGVLDVFHGSHEFMGTPHMREKMRESESNATAIDSFRAYSVATSNYGDVEHRILDIMELKELINTEIWTIFFKRPDEEDPVSVHRIIEMSERLSFAVNKLPFLLSLIEQQYVGDLSSSGDKLPKQFAGKSLLSVIILEDDRQFSSPQRLTYLFDSISNFYNVFAEIGKKNGNDLIVLACDSGSDKSFEFLGLAKLMEQVKELIIAIWDRRVFHRHRHVSEFIAVVAESLPVISKINELKDDGSLEPEQAELLKRKIIDGATKFIEAGAIIPEMEAASSYSPRELMRPEPKLLIAPLESPVKETKEQKSGRRGRPVEKRKRPSSSRKNS